jgi:hypothetical protein
MIRTRIRKLSNPRRVKVKRHNMKKRRKMSPKQIRIFGTKRQKAALKAASKRKRNPKRVSRVRVHRAPVKRRTKRSNPALIVTLGAMNPHRKRRKPVAKAKSNTRRRRRHHVTNRRRTRRSNPKRVYVRRRHRNAVHHRRRRRSNPKVVVRYRTRRHNRKHYNRRRRNPTLFGSSLTSKEGLMIIGGGLAGVAATKFIPALLPTSITSGIASSNLGKTVLTGVTAVAAGWLAGKWDKGFGNGVLFGGLMQTASVALNSFLPSVYQQLGLSLGDFLPGQFSVPQNPIRAGIAPPPAAAPAGGQARINMNGLARAYGSAY